MQRLALARAWETLNKPLSDLDDLLEAADDILANSTASAEQQKKAAETIVAKSNKPLMVLKAQNKLKTIKVGFSVAAVVVDPNSVRYEEMATPSDPAFAAYARNFEIGNFWYWFGTFWKEMPKAERRPILKAMVDTDGNLLPAYQDLNTKNMNGLGIPRQDELRTLLKQMMGKGFTPWKIKAEKEAVETKDLLPKIDALGTQYHSVCGISRRRARSRYAEGARRGRVPAEGEVAVPGHQVQHGGEVESIFRRHDSQYDVFPRGPGR